MSRRRAPLFLASVSLGAMLLSTGALAQTQTGPVTPDRGGDASTNRVTSDPTATAGNAPQEGIADIVVTAERREASLQSVPIAVTALSQARLADAAIGTGSELERFIPSLKMSPNITSPTNLSPSLRGSVTQDASLTVAESGFGIYIDDVWIGRLNGNNTTLNDIERVEALRGPQGTLYGRNTLAGALKFITRVPGDRTWLEGSVGYGNYDQYLVAASVGGPISSNGLAGSASFQFNGRNGYGRNLATGKRFGNEDNFAGRVKLRYSGIDGLDLTASVSYANSRNDSAVQVPFTTTVAANRVATTNQIIPTLGYYNVNVARYATGPAPIRSQPFGKTEQIIGSFTAAYEIGDATLKSITGYVDTKDNFTADFSGTGTIEAGTPSRDRQFTEELQITGTALQDKLTYIAGAFYLHAKAHQDFGWFFLTPASQTFSHNKSESIAGFGQVTYEVIPNLKATAGIRYTKDTKDFDISINVLPTSIIPSGPQPPVVLHQSYDAWTPKFGLDYQIPTGEGFFDKLLVYVSAARGFRSGGFNGINIFDLGVARTPYFPETNWSYEGGLKTDFLDRRVRVNVDYFINRISGLLLNASVAGSTAFPVQNSGSATIRGFEYELQVNPVSGLNIYASGALLHGKFRTLNPTSAPAQAITLYNVANPKTPQTPDYTVTVGFDYEVPLGASDSAIRLGGDYSRSGSYTLAATNDLTVSAYDRFNGFVAFEFAKRFEAKVTVKNIENDKSFITGSRGLGGFIALPPRTVLGTLSYKM